MESSTPSKRVIRTNRLVHSVHYAAILQEYNLRLVRDGKVNDKKFFEEVVSTLLPGYSLMTWYQFLRKFKSPSGGITEAKSVAVAENTTAVAKVEEEKLKTTILSNQDATAKLLSLALNISADRLNQLLQNPQLMSAKDAIEIGLKAMKAQDSRMHAIGKVREDSREQEKFDRAFNGAAYGQ